MKGDAQPLIKFFDGSDKRFIIPLYQRNYDRKEDNCEQLFHHLIKLHESDWRKRSMSTHSERFNPPTFEPENGLKTA